MALEQVSRVANIYIQTSMANNDTNISMPKIEYREATSGNVSKNHFKNESPLHSTRRQLFINKSSELVKSGFDATNEIYSTQNIKEIDETVPNIVE